MGGAHGWTAPGWSSFPQGNQPPNPWGYVPNGFMNLLQQPQIPLSTAGENFHFVGVPGNFAGACSPPMLSKGTPPSAPSDKQGTSRKSGNVSIDIDSDDGGVNRTRKTKGHWTYDEEVALASAWLNNSNDPIGGNEKKSEKFWGDIRDEFNKTAPADRRRDTNQLKIHWTRLKASINSFNGCWSKVTKLSKSGYSDDLLMDEAQKMYTREHGKPFTLVHWWRTLKNQPKWCANIARLEKENNKDSPVQVDDVQNAQRPIGRDAAKAQHNGKRKAADISDGIVLLGDNLTKIIQVQQERKQEREKLTHTQLEVAKLQLKAAKEQKEAKMYEVYNSILHQDTSNMTEELNAKRQKTLESMELKLFSDDEV